MTSSTLSTSIEYSNLEQQVTWCGVSLDDENEFNTFMATDVAPRLYDEEGSSALTEQLRSLANTGFDHSNIDSILAAETPEERDWAIGESIAEAYLAKKHEILWPWNMERDKRTPKASLPGSDLVGFEVRGDEVRLAFGEVKSSTDNNSPPNVMYGRDGMISQIENLSDRLPLTTLLIKWLFVRCRNTEFQSFFESACSLFIRSGNTNIAYYGVLIRDTNPNELDLSGRGEALADTIQDPATCELIAIHIPCKIKDLPSRVSGGET